MAETSEQVMMSGQPEGGGIIGQQTAECTSATGIELLALSLYYYNIGREAIGCRQ